jgi:hypothetical protein
VGNGIDRSDPLTPAITFSLKQVPLFIDNDERWTSHRSKLVGTRSTSSRTIAKTHRAAQVNRLFHA